MCGRLRSGKRRRYKSTPDKSGYRKLAVGDSTSTMARMTGRGVKYWPAPPLTSYACLACSLHKPRLSDPHQPGPILTVDHLYE